MLFVAFTKTAWRKSSLESRRVSTAPNPLAFIAVVVPVLEAEP
jgi:hypothetical protein